MESSDPRPRHITVEMHPLLQKVVLSDVEESMTANDLLDKYGAKLEKQYHLEKGAVRNECTGVIPFNPAHPSNAESMSVVTLSHRNADINF